MHQSSDSKKIRILLVDDHIVVRMGLSIAANNESDMEVVAEADNGQKAIEAYREHKPDVVVLDLRMPMQGGFDTMRALRREFGSVRLLVFSSYASGNEAFQAFKEGASGFVVKEMPIDQLLEAIRRVHAGEQFIPPDIAKRMSSLVLSQLSPREIEVLTLIARGLSNKEIGSALKVAEATVKVHVTSILTKLDVADRTQAILAGVKRGIIQLE